MYAPGVEHGELAKDFDILKQAILFFRPGPEQADEETFGATSAKLSNTPQPFDGVKLEALGPVRGYVSDETGNVMGNYLGGPEDITSQGIPGGSYNASADSDYQSFFLNDEGSYTGELEVVGRGSVQLEARTYAQSQARRVAVFRVRAPAGAKLRIEFATGRNPGSLRLSIDRDGDGTADRKVAPDSVVVGAAARETDPPNTAATFETVAEGRSSVVLSTKDGPQGSGVADTYYMLQGDTRSRLYTGPFAAPSGTIVRFLSVDKAGNMERVKKVVADADFATQVAEGETTKR